MIFVRDKGRMCNNILQYGHLYAWGREHNRRTMSMRFAYKYHYFHICETPYHNFFIYLLAKYGCKWKLIPSVSFNEENTQTAAQETKMLKHRLILAEGWYARFPDLFIKYKDEIKALFQFLPEVTDKINEELSPYDKDTIRLGVHIRRGDYATWQGGQYLYSDAQYVNIIKQFILLSSNTHVEIFICGNDQKLNKEYYKNELGEDCIHFPQGNPGEDLCLLSKCDYLIGAPSTFTLVAAMYNDSALYWIQNANTLLEMESFKHFNELFTHII